MTDSSVKKDFNKFALLRVKTALAVRNYKFDLYKTNKQGKIFTQKFKENFLVSLLNDHTKFVIFLKIVFPTKGGSLGKFLEELRSCDLRYLLLSETATAAITSVPSLSWLTLHTSGGALLVIDAKNFLVYRKLISEILDLESSSKDSLFNKVELILTKELVSLISFNSKTSSTLRKLYTLEVSHQSILLEIISTLNSPMSAVTQPLDTEVSAFGLTYYNQLLPLFPFKD